MTTREICQALRAGPHTFPGGYPIFFVGVDGACFSFAAVKANLFEFARDTREYRRAGYNSGKALQTVEVNWESDLTCDETSESIERAYPEESEAK